MTVAYKLSGSKSADRIQLEQKNIAPNDKGRRKLSDHFLLARTFCLRLKLLNYSMRENFGSGKFCIELVWTGDGGGGGNECAFVASNSSDFICKRTVFLYSLHCLKMHENHYYRSFLCHCSVACERWRTWNCYTVKSYNNNNSKHRAVLGCGPTIFEFFFYLHREQKHEFKLFGFVCTIPSANSNKLLLQKSRTFARNSEHRIICCMP